MAQEIQDSNSSTSSGGKQPNRKFISPMTAFSIMINVLFGTGPIFVPGVFLGCGWLMSTILLVAISIVSWIAAEYVIESMSNFNAIILTEEKRVTADEVEAVSESYADDNIRSLISNKIQADTEITENPDEPEQQSSEDPFKLRFIAEMGQMSRMMWGKAGDITITLILNIYLIGVLISKVITSANILSQMFHDMSTPVKVVDNYYFWLSLFCTTAIAFSFSDIAGIKILQSSIAGFRFFVIFLLIAGPLYLIFDGQGGGLTPVYDGKRIEPFHPSGFEDYFSSSILALLCHHSLPSIMTNVAPPRKIRIINATGFIVGCVALFLISVLGIAAFQGQMLEPANIATYTQNFEYRIDWIYYISSFYMFLNIAAFPVLVITCRNNAMKCFFPDKVPKQSWKLTKLSVIITIIIIAPIVLLSIVAKDNIEKVINVVGGIFGVVLMLLIPSALVIGTRKNCERLGLDVSENPFRSIFYWKYLPYIMFVVGIVCMVYNGYSDVMSWVDGDDD